MPHVERVLEHFAGVQQRGDGYRACCPAHDDTHPSLDIIIQEDGHVQLHCRSSRCSLASILLAAGLTPDDLYPDPDDETILDADPSVIEGDLAVPPVDSLLDDAHFILRDQTYCSLLQQLPLEGSHRENLLRRGLTDNEIDSGGYGSINFANRNQALTQLRSEFSDAELLSVPGFVGGDDGEITMAGPAQGLVVPVNDVQGRIIALKVRLDVVQENRGKYCSISGGGGESCGIPTHVPLGIQGPISEVRVTEGELKADAATVLSGIPTIGIPGVGNWHPVLSVLHELGAETVRVAFDADHATKPHVAQQLVNFVEALRDAGFEVVLETWDLAVAKGIDDLLVAGQLPNVLAGDDVTSYLDGLQLTETDLSAVDTCVESEPSTDAPPADGTSATSSVTVLPFPVDVFPDALQQFALQAAQSLNCPLDLIAVQMVAACGTAIGGSRTLQVTSDWQESPCMYVAIVAPPGGGKSPAKALVCAPLERRQNQLKHQYKQELEAYEAAIDSHLPPAMTAFSAPPSQSAPCAGSMPASSNVQPPPSKPILQRVTTGDATTESLAPILRDNPRGLLMGHDELAGWVRSQNQYKGGKGADRQFYLSVWAGQPLIIDRKGKEPVIVPHPFLNVMGGIQPDMLSLLADEKGRADGFLDRILCSFPETMPAQHWTEHTVEAQVKQQWSDTLQILFNLEMQHIEDEGIDRPQIVNFTTDGNAAWIEWFDSHTDEINSPALDAALKGPWLKMKSYFLRLGLVIHFCRVACGEVESEDVDAESVARTVRLIDYFKSHARKVYRHLPLDAGDRRVVQVISWIRGLGGECTVRELARASIPGIKRSSDASHMLKDLVDRGCGALVNRKAGNGKSVTHFVLGSAASDSVG